MIPHCQLKRLGDCPVRCSVWKTWQRCLRSPTWYRCTFPRSRNRRVNQRRATRTHATRRRFAEFCSRRVGSPSAIRQAIEAGQLSQYISDFPTPELLGINGVIATPHLGASTDEAEENCAMMVADQVIDFLANGNIKILSISLQLTLSEVRQGVASLS